MELLKENAKRMGYFFYLMDPRDHVYEKMEDVKDYYKEVTPLIFVTVLLEQVIRYYQKKPIWRINDTISNVCHGILMELSKIPFKGAEVFVYAWVYKNYRLVDLPWDCPWTWLACWFCTDFGYYWMHRMIHQINILWAIHETHHTPEDMHFTSPMRNHIFLLPIHWITYLPMSLFVPPTTYLVHYQISIIYQYWLHSEVIHKLPAFMEYVLSTPSHHRAHHGRNRRYIDKNFGGFLIIWDRLFGTFEEETPEDPPLYGVTKQMDSFNPLYIETRHFINIWQRVKEYKTVRNKLSAIFKGPGWSPGKPWTGDINDIPEPVPQIPKYDPQPPLWYKYYTILHFGLFLDAYLHFALSMTLLTKMTVAVIACYLSYNCITFGFILDKSSYVLPAELFRCLLYFLVDRLVFHEVSRFGALVVAHITIYRICFVLSVALWTSLSLYSNVRIAYKQKNL